jgi:hypothetical protein
MMKLVSTLALGAALSLAAPAASAAEGLLARPAQLPAPARAALQKEIDADRAVHPAAFAAVRAVHGVRPEVYRRFRNPQPLAVPELRALGKDGLLALLSELAFDGQPTAGMTEPERSALHVGMIEAVGLLRDARSGPVLRAVLEGGTRDAAVLQAAADALGRLCGDGELGALTAHTAAADPRRQAAIHGLGQCRRVEAARHLGGLLGAATDVAEVERAANALATVGSSWAWKALGPAAEATGLGVREAAARALVAALPRYAGDTRARVASAIVMVDHPALPTLLATTRVRATPELAAVIDDILKKIGKP